MAESYPNNPPPLLETTKANQGLPRFCVAVSKCSWSCKFMQQREGNKDERKGEVTPMFLGTKGPFSFP